MMNQNHMPYGQPVPMQPPQKRHDGSYGPMMPRMRPPQYQQYYQQHMGPMTPQYPQHYAQGWYGYPQQPQQHQHAYTMHQPRHPYYSQPPMASPQYHNHHQGSQVPSEQQPYHSPAAQAADPSFAAATAAQRMQHQQSPRPVHTPSQFPPQQPLRSASTTSTAPVQTPPSPPLSTSTTVSTRKEAPTHAESSTPEQTPSSAVQSLPPAVPFDPPTPWLSFEGDSFPPKAPRQRRRIPRSRLANEPVVFPAAEPAESATIQTQPAPVVPEALAHLEASEEHPTSSVPLSTPTPTTLASDAMSDAASTQPTTPASPNPPPSSKSQQTPTQSKSRPSGTVVPVVPVLPQSPNAVRRPHRESITSVQTAPSIQVPSAEQSGPVPEIEVSNASSSSAEPVAPTPVAPPKPTSWANLFRPSAPASNSASAAPSTSSHANGVIAVNNESLDEVLSNVSVEPQQLSFLQPRGLVNTGNMCYMNSVLQVLIFCVPFYGLLEKIKRRAVYKFKSDTPLLDALILFVQEYTVLHSAPSAEQLRSLLKADDYEKYGDPFIPEYVYNAITPLPRFREMRRGHQQDAQEFLGFLLEELHEECSRAMRSGTSASSGRSTPVGSAPSGQDSADQESGWMEVGHKQKAAITRSSGNIAADSPINNIFGGKLRSELKVAGNKLSVTLEPYQPLQLDIGSPEVSNIVDALKGLTKPESMQGEFQTARGQRSTATKQVFIETLPPVLILHLKRFQYDSTTKRAEKIWKKVGYPLELEIPKEVFPSTTRNKYTAHGGLPKYRLTGVIYHHGKNANGGHYTVDIRRQDGKEWIRLDDTLLRRVRSEDVAEGGSEEDPKVLAAALERHKQGKTANNRFEQIEQGEEEEESDNDKAWSQVNTHSRSKSTLSAAVNGAATPAKSSGPQTPREKFSVKDNKVAYLLFYQKAS